MSGEKKHVGEPSSDAGADAAVLDALRAALSQADEPGRYRLLASLFGELAEGSALAGHGAGRDDRTRALSKKQQDLAEEKARLEDLLATTKADLAQRTAELEAAQVRGAEQQRVLDEQRVRLDAFRSERAELEAELVAKNSALHSAEADNERLQLQVQRAEAAGVDFTRVDQLETDKKELVAELEKVRQALEQLRRDKDAEIEKLKSGVSSARAAAAQGADALLAQLWQRLASAKPPLVEGHIPPTAQAAEHLVDAFAELVRFADNFDKSMRVFLDKYTKHYPSVKVPWEVYARREDVQATARETIAVKSGKPVGLLKMRLRILYNWCQAAMIGADSAVESIASELETQLRGPLGTESDPNRKIKDYVRDDGHYLLMERIRELRSQKVAETFGRSG